MTGDLLAHYMIHQQQEMLRIDDEIDQKYYNRQSSYQYQGYQGIMITYPSYVTFGLKMGLLVIESMKYKFSYDMS